MELLASGGQAAVAALIASGFAVGVGLLNFLAQNPGAPTEEDLQLLRRDVVRNSKSRKNKPRKKKGKQQQHRSRDGNGAPPAQSQADCTAPPPQAEEASSSVSALSSSAASAVRGGGDGLRRRRGKRSEFQKDGELAEEQPSPAAQGGSSGTGGGRGEGKTKKRKTKKDRKKQRWHRDEGDGEEDVDELFERALKGEGVFSENQNHRVLDEFGNRLTRPDLPPELLSRRNKMLGALGLDETKIRLAVEYAKQGKRVPLSQGQKVTSCLDRSLFLFLLLALVVVVVKDFRVPLMLWAKHKLPREYDLVASMFADTVKFWVYVYHWGQLPAGTPGGDDVGAADPGQLHLGGGE